MFAVFNHYRGRGYKTRLRNLGDEVWDRRLGIRTFGFHPGTGVEGEKDWLLHYEPTPYSDIFRLLKLAGVNHDDVFIDVGAGLGRAVFAASWLGAKRSVGIEIVPELCGKAQQNYLRSRLATRSIDFICDNALNFHSWDCTILFMFHPFNKDILRQVLNDIHSTRQRREPKVLRVIYLNPVFDSILRDAGWLQCITRVPAASTWLPGAIPRYAATIWRSNSL